MVTTRSMSAPKKVVEDSDEILTDEPRSDDEDDSDADEHGNLRDFVVYDEILDKPADHKALDQAWSTWTPATKGSLRYKKVVEKFSK